MILIKIYLSFAKLVERNTHGIRDMSEWCNFDKGVTFLCVFII